MSQVALAPVKELALASQPLTADQVRQMTEAIAADFSNYRLLNEAVQELETQTPSPALQTRLGICYHLLGRYRMAVEALGQGDGAGLALFYQGRAQAALDDHRGAAASYEAASRAGFDKDLCALGVADAQRSLGDAQASLATLDRLSGAVEQTAEYLYQRGATISVLGGNPSEVVALFERAVDVDPRHPGALFGLARENDLRGNDETALELYQKATSRLPVHVGALLNLGLLYEDRQQYEKARNCYMRILESYPNEPRARLFLKDSQASNDMYVDEEAQRRRDRLAQLLSIPVTDFELSVRSRNCLQKMGVLTLGDLTRTTEQELLSSKNFGETSLTEIKEMLSSKGLQLGQFVHERAAEEIGIDTSSMSADEQALLNKPIAELNLSVRARKCMMRLGINTVAELIRRTGDELLEVKNFGVTSLNEVREKLTAHGLRLRGD